MSGQRCINALTSFYYNLKTIVLLQITIPVVSIVGKLYSCSLNVSTTSSSVDQFPTPNSLELRSINTDYCLISYTLSTSASL